jgi:hypothetical protein
VLGDPTKQVLGEIQILVVSSLASNFKGVTKIEGLCENDYFLKKKITL